MKIISPELNIMIKASEKASKALIRDFGEIEKLQVSAKGPSDFVSNADTRSEKIIINELTKSKKNFSILSEENGSKINKGVIMVCTPDLYYQEFVVEGTKFQQYQHDFLSRVNEYYQKRDRNVG